MRHTLFNALFALILMIPLFALLTGCGGAKKTLPLGRYDYYSPLHGDLAKKMGQLAAIEAIDAEYEALIAPLNRKVYWRYKTLQGYVVAIRETSEADGLICREFTHVITSDDPPTRLFSGKCMKEGYWR